MGDWRLSWLFRSFADFIGGNLLFVHAGVHPQVSLKDWFSKHPYDLSSDDHYLWVRWPFFHHEGKFEGGHLVVHGHTLDKTILAYKGRRQDEPHRIDGWRLGLDGGSYATGEVCGAEFRFGQYRIYRVGDER